MSESNGKPSNIFGRVDKPEQINLEPFDFTIIGYRVEGEKRIEEPFTFTCTGSQPFGAHLDYVRAVSTEHMTTLDRSITLIERSLIDDAERKRFSETLHAPDILFPKGVLMLADLGDWILGQYTGRPTKPRTAQRSGRARGGQKSMGAAGARA